MICSAFISTMAAVITDTIFYSERGNFLRNIVRRPVITPLNSILYNSKASNLAIHGHHPFYQHFLANLPQLLGPALPLLVFLRRATLPLVAGITGVMILSAVPHQEARFLLPAVPLILSSVKTPTRFNRAFLGIWLVFNLVLGRLMGTFHQGGIVPAQLWLGRSPAHNVSTVEVFWWKTYSPPTWLLGERIHEVRTTDLMGLPAHSLQDRICFTNTSDGASLNKVMVAPWSATFLDQFSVAEAENTRGLMRLRRLWRTVTHVNLDDLDFGDDGIMATLWRVLGRRGLVIWNVECP